MIQNHFSEKNEALNYLCDLVFPYPVCFEVYICIEYIIKTADIIPGEVIVYFSNLLRNHIEVTNQIQICKTLQNVTQNFFDTKSLNEIDNDFIGDRP